MCFKLDFFIFFLWTLLFVIDPHIGETHSVLLFCFCPLVHILLCSPAELKWGCDPCHCVCAEYGLSSSFSSSFCHLRHPVFFFLSTEAVYAQANSDKTECRVCLFSHSALALYQFYYLLVYIYNLCMAILTTTTGQEIRCLENSFSGAPLCWFVLSRKPSAHVRGVNFLSIFCHTARTHHQPPTVFCSITHTHS